MSDLIVVAGEECLNYINKPIGFCDRGKSTIDTVDVMSLQRSFIRQTGSGCVVGTEARPYYITNMTKWNHNTNLRKCGVILARYDDGGMLVRIMSNDTINCQRNGNIEGLPLRNITQFKYTLENVVGTTKYRLPAGTKINYPTTGGEYDTHDDNYADVRTFINYGHYAEESIPFDDLLSFNPDMLPNDFYYGFMRVTEGQFNLNNQDLSSDVIPLSLSDDNVFTYGCALTLTPTKIYEKLCDNPLAFQFGDIYSGFTMMLNSFNTSCDGEYDLTYWSETADIFYRVCTTTNNVAIPFNIILTENINFARDYVENGVLPPDAILYPLDWDNLPNTDESIPTGDKPDDFPDDNNPDDDERDFDPTPTETPTYTVNQLTNYNWYWLTVPEWSAFISWFWNDIGDYSDFDDIIAKVKGLYNDVASAVIMCRYYPVDISWIGGLGTQSNIKLGMIEKAGAVDTISQATSLRAVDIGNVHIGTKYKSFMDMSPYSQLSLYLPWHGYIDLDMNLFNGHDVYVKALYDYLSGTIQYYIYYDNELLVNTILCKMAMDIPITLQTKNDRDSAIFNNVSSTIGGLVGAGVGIASGNPIGMTLGVTQGVGAFNSANASAPMRLMGNVGESGAYIGCQNCFVVVRRPTIQPSDGNSTTMKGLSTWKKNVGMLCGYGYTLSDLSGQGFTVCHSPRIDFTSTVPLQKEVDEIYSYLEKGVIL